MYTRNTLETLFLSGFAGGWLSLRTSFKFDPFVKSLSRNVTKKDSRWLRSLHGKMHGMESEILQVLASPEFVRVSRSDPPCGCFTSCYAQTLVGGKRLCVVIK
jgi:hypothetical protein